MKSLFTLLISGLIFTSCFSNTNDSQILVTENLDSVANPIVKETKIDTSSKIIGKDTKVDTSSRIKSKEDILRLDKENMQKLLKNRKTL